MKKSLIYALTACTALLLASCDSDTDQSAGIDTVSVQSSDTEIVDTNPETVSEDTESEPPETESTAPNTASADEVQKLIDNAPFLGLNISDDSSDEDILQAGDVAARYFSESAAKYFGYGVDSNWKINYNNSENSFSSDMIGEYQTSDGFWKCEGLYIDRSSDLYVPMNDEECKQFLKSFIGLTENGYNELCDNSPSKYKCIDGSFYVASGDGGQAGWSYCRITGYEKGDNAYTFNCERVGTVEDWGYEEDMIKPFTFSIAWEDGLWKLDSVSYGEGFFEMYKMIK